MRSTDHCGDVWHEELNYLTLHVSHGAHVDERRSVRTAARIIVDGREHWTRSDVCIRCVCEREERTFKHTAKNFFNPREFAERRQWHQNRECASPTRRQRRTLRYAETSPSHRSRKRKDLQLDLGF